MCCTKVLLLSWEKINSERNNEEVKEKRQCSESKIRNRIRKSTKAKEREETLKKNECGEMTELEES
jgi:hypothetical protein